MSAHSAASLRQSLASFTVIDPACGSGAFLVHVLERLSELQRVAGDTRDVAVIRREVLGRAIHGVDINPMAVWLCELRLWLSVVIESAETRMSAVPPLPNLDCNIRVGDALAGSSFAMTTSLLGPSAAHARLHARYVRASGPGKTSLRKALANEERRRALTAIDRHLAAIAADRRDRLQARRASDLFGERTHPDAAEQAAMRLSRQRAAQLRRERTRIADGGALPFSFPSHFGAVHARGGFQLVIGNPPWVRVHNIPAAERVALRNRFAVYRHAAWDAGVRGGRASAGFASQVDLSALFVERSADLARHGGCVALLLPAKLWRSLSGGGVRALVSQRLQLRSLEDWTGAPSVFDAAVYPSVLVAQRGRGECDDVIAQVRLKTATVQWRTVPEALRLSSGDVASPLILLPPPPRAGFELIRARGVSLAESALGYPLLGVKSGHNDAFVVRCVDQHGESTCVEHDGRHGTVQQALLRPLLRGEALTPWSIVRSTQAIVWTHDAERRPLAALPDDVARWLAPWKRQLAARSDLRGGRVWWTLFRTEASDNTHPRVVWGDFGRRPRAAILPAGDPTVPLNTCYVLPCPDPVDALAFCALLNGPLAAAWLNVVAEPARGGWHRYLAWTISLLPIPCHWNRARNELARIAEGARAGTLPADAELLDASCAAYGIRRSAVEPLIEWSCIPSTR